MSNWLELYYFIISAFLSLGSRLWDLFTLHFWVLFPFTVALICGFITLFIKLLFRVIKNV